jgi:triose/dihydroxyacetone kinase / FAD-AMP lyase (cyclizing)
VVAVLSNIANGNVTGEDVVGAVLTIAQVAEEKMGGTSGALFSCVSSSPVSKKY